MEMTQYRFFKVSINLSFYGICNDTRAFKINNKLHLVFLSVWYSLVSLLLGWWGFSLSSIRNTFEAIHINSTGGVDCSKEMDEFEYDDKTNFIWNNLLRKTTDRITKKEVEIIIEIQEEYEQFEKERHSDENINFIILNLGRIDIHRITRNEIRDLFNAMSSYNITSIEENFA